MLFCIGVFCGGGGCDCGLKLTEKEFDMHDIVIFMVGLFAYGADESLRRAFGIDADQCEFLALMKTLGIAKSVVELRLFDEIRVR